MNNVVLETDRDRRAVLLDSYNRSVYGMKLDLQSGHVRSRYDNGA